MKKMLIASAIAALLSTSVIPGSAEAAGRWYVIKSGDTCWKTSQQYHIQLSDLLRQNPHLKDGKWIYPGMVIKLPNSAPQHKNPANQPDKNAQEEQEKNTNQNQQTPSTPATPSENTTPPKQEPTQPAQNSLHEFEQEVIRLVNVERQKAGLSALKTNVELSNVARIKSNDMKDKGYFSHTSPTYGSPFDMMKSFGIRYSYAGENIAMGQRTPEEVMRGWMNSQGHRNNILNPNFTEIGVGYAVDKNGRAYWTQMFIRP